MLDAEKRQRPRRIGSRHPQAREEGDGIFRGAVSALFHNEAIDAKQLLREKEVLEGLENAIDATNHVADTLTNLAVKHG